MKACATLKLQGFAPDNSLPRERQSSSKYHCASSLNKLSLYLKENESKWKYLLLPTYMLDREAKLFFNVSFSRFLQ